MTVSPSGSKSHCRVLFVCLFVYLFVFVSLFICVYLFVYLLFVSIILVFNVLYRCLQQLGANHGYLVSSLVPELLSTHPFFMGKEPDVDDPACILPHSTSTIRLLPPLVIFLDFLFLRHLYLDSCIQCSPMLSYYPSSLPQSCLQTLYLPQRHPPSPHPFH